MSDKESISRREALKGGSAAAVAVGAGILQDQLIGTAKAQTNEPRIQLGPDYAIDDKSPGFVIEHQPSGATFQYDENQNRWVATDPVEVPSLIDGAGVTHSGELEDANHDHSGEAINPNTVNTDERTVTNLGVEATLGSAQTIANASFETVVFNSVLTDDTGDLNTSTGKFSAPYSGDYLLSANVDWDEGFADDSRVAIDLYFGADSRRVFDQESFSGLQAPTIPVVYTKKDVSAGDDIYMEVFQNSDGTADIGVGTQMTISHLG